MPSSSMGVMSWSKRLGQSPWKAAFTSKLHSWNLRTMPHTCQAQPLFVPHPRNSCRSGMQVQLCLQSLRTQVRLQMARNK